MPAHGELTDIATGHPLALDDAFAANKQGVTLYTLEVLYTPASFSGWGGDSFRYFVSDGVSAVEGVVDLVPSLIPQPTDRHFEIDEDELTYFVFAMPGVTSLEKRTRNFKVVITALPSHGMLYQVSVLPTSTHSPRAALLLRTTYYLLCSPYYLLRLVLTTYCV